MLKSRSLMVFFSIVILQQFQEIIVIRDVISGCAHFAYVVIRYNFLKRQFYLDYF